MQNKDRNFKFAEGEVHLGVICTGSIYINICTIM